MLRRNVVLFHSGALGDFVLTWPVAMALGRLYPQSRVMYVTAAQKGRLAEKVLGVEWVDVEAGWHGLYGEGGLPEKAQKLLAGAHSVFGIGTTGEAWVENVRRLAPGAGVMVMPGRPSEAHPGHAAEFLVEQLAAMPVVHAAAEQMLRGVRERGIRYERARRMDVLVHPGSGSREKCWPIERFVHLIAKLRGEGFSVECVVGEVEEERCGEEVAKLARVAAVHRPTTYVDLLERMGQAGVVVANDSGPGHLAGIVGRGTVSIFGPTDAAVWAPIGPRVRVVRGDSMERIGVEEVCAAVREMAREMKQVESGGGGANDE